MIQHRVGSCTVKAFADDIATVVTDFARDQATLARTFEEFERMSALDFNFKKTVCIPLWEKGIEDVRSMLSGGSWSDLTVASHGTYLGLVQGPGKESISWQKPTCKYLQRCSNWSNIHEGLYFTTTAYNTFCASVLMFIAQLETPTADVLAAEEASLKLLTPGPALWRSLGPQSDLFYLKESFGQQASFQSVTYSAQAAKLRVVAHHNMWRRAKQNCPKFGNSRSIHNMYNKIRTLRNCNPKFPDRDIAWSSWYNNSFIYNLVNNQKNLERDVGIVLNDLLESLVGPDGWTEMATEKVKGLIQRKTLEAIKKKHAPDPQVRLRHKIMRWYPISPHIFTRRHSPLTG